MKMTFRKNISRLETALGAAIVGIALIGAINEFYFKDIKIREYSKIAAVSSLLPFILTEGYRRLGRRY